MSTENSQATASTTAAPTTQDIASKTGRRKLRNASRKKRVLKLKTDSEFAKQYFEAKSKRSIDKKSAFRKKKNRKK